MLLDIAISWTKSLKTRLRGLALAREKNLVFAWDKQRWFYLLNQAGDVQGQTHLDEAAAVGAAADNGSAFAGASQTGQVAWFNPDVKTRWQRSLPVHILALAFDPLGDFLAIADAKSGVHFFNAAGKLVGQFQSPRPLHHLAFVADAPQVVGCAEFGLVGAFDLKGNWAWRDAPVMNAGALAVNGDSSTTILACFSEGLQLYGPQGIKRQPIILQEPCQSVCTTFTGDIIAAAGMGNTLYFFQPSGTLVTVFPIEKPLQSLCLGPLGTYAFLILKDGELVRLKIGVGE